MREYPQHTPKRKQTAEECLILPADNTARPTHQRILILYIHVLVYISKAY